MDLTIFNWFKGLESIRWRFLMLLKKTGSKKNYPKQTNKTDKSKSLPYILYKRFLTLNHEIRSTFPYR